MRSKLTIALIAAAASLGVAGCGGSDGDQGNTGGTAAASTPVTAASATTPADTSAATTPQTTDASSPKSEWASKLCNAMQGKIKPIQPPSIQGTSPEATHQGLVTFIGAIVDTESKQLETLEAVGPPPGANAKDDWKAAEKNLSSIQKKVKKVQKNLEATSPTDQKQLTAVIADLGKQLKALSTYQGPVVELSASKAIGKEVTADPTCKAVS